VSSVNSFCNSSTWIRELRASSWLGCFLRDFVSSKITEIYEISLRLPGWTKFQFISSLYSFWPIESAAGDDNTTTATTKAVIDNISDERRGPSAAIKGLSQIAKRQGRIIDICLSTVEKKCLKTQEDTAAQGGGCTRLLLTTSPSFCTFCAFGPLPSRSSPPFGCISAYGSLYRLVDFWFRRTQNEISYYISKAAVKSSRGSWIYGSIFFTQNIDEKQAASSQIYKEQNFLFIGIGNCSRGDGKASLRARPFAVNKGTSWY